MCSSDLLRDRLSRLPVTLLAAFLACVSASAQGQSGGRGGTPPVDPGQQLLNPGDEVDGNASDQRRQRPSPTGGVPGVPASGATPDGKAGAQVAQRWGVVLATLVAGYYNANAALYRFAATELVAPAQRERAISWVATLCSRTEAEMAAAAEAISVTMPVMPSIDAMQRCARSSTAWKIGRAHV